MANLKTLIQHLNKDLERELTQIVRYLHHSFIVMGPSRGHLVGFFRKQVQESMDHAIRLGEKVTALGGHPTVSVSQIFEPGEQTLEEMLKEDLESEEEALREYKKHHKETAQDIALRVLLEQIIFEEQTHIEEFKKYLEK
ncbi:MAG: bacterioferritin [Candidatus Omnitrophica bacterium]|nr:bacterioferritin [Candidatus Omnitrophota bacterium]